MAREWLPPVTVAAPLARAETGEMEEGKADEATDAKESKKGNCPKLQMVEWANGTSKQRLRETK